MFINCVTEPEVIIFILELENAHVYKPDANGIFLFQLKRSSFSVSTQCRLSSSRCINDCKPVGYENFMNDIPR